MNPRASCLQLGIILLGILALVPVASAQNPTIPNAKKVDGSPTPATGTEIKAFIDAYVPALAGAEVDARTQARNELVAAVTLPQGQTISSTYVDQFSSALNTALKPLASNPDWIVRMNAAIVASRVAERADSTRLLEVTQTLLSDKTEGVQLWALRAARSILPAELRTPGAAKNDKLIGEILAVAQQRKSGAIAAEAFYALSLDYNNAARYKSISASTKTEMFNAVAQPILSIMRNRVAEYYAGTVSDPGADKIASNFLVSTNVWPSLDAKTQSAVLQVLLDLLTASGQAAAKAGGPGKNDELLQSMRDSARAISAWSIKVPGSESLNRILQDVYSPQNMKPWDQLPQVATELMKLDKNVKAPGAPTTAPAAK